MHAIRAIRASIALPREYLDRIKTSAYEDKLIVAGLHGMNDKFAARPKVKILVAIRKEF
jgi:hypothetical protein